MQFESVESVEFLLISLCSDINQLKKTMQLTGTPGPELLAKIKSDEVVGLVSLLCTTQTVAQHTSLFECTVIAACEGCNKNSINTVSDARN